MASAVINVAPEGNLTRYLQEIRKFPMLTPEEELSLSHRWRDNEDMEAAHKLVTSHLRLVAKTADTIRHGRHLRPRLAET